MKATLGIVHKIIIIREYLLEDTKIQLVHPTEVLDQKLLQLLNRILTIPPISFDKPTSGGWPWKVAFRFPR
jgi:hypothetical protein